MDTVSCVLALSSIMICEKWLESKRESSLARVKHPAVVRVQTNTRNWYKNFSDGKRNSPLSQLEIGLRFGLTFRTSYDLAYIRNISPKFRTLTRRSAISSQAEFELAQIKTHLFVDRTISSTAAIKVRVFPVPVK